jgi:Caspase domain
VPDPSLIVDRSTELAATPGLHAIIIGVSEYQFLPGVEETPGVDFAALKKLQSSALSAWMMAQKIIALDREKRLKRPLKTLRLLLAPSALEFAKEPVLAASGAPMPNRDAISDAVWAWRDNVSVSKEEQALFFFSGHGVGRLREESILLAEDFLQPHRKDLENAFNFRNIFNGMVPSKEFPTMGREQFYFVDACRDKPDALDKLETTDSHDIFDPALGSYDYRVAPSYFPTATGGVAAGVPGEPTFFTEALLWALDNASHDKVEITGIDGEVWPITAESLKDGFEAANSMFHDRIVLGEMAGDPMLCFARETPRLSLTIALKPETVHDKIDKVLLCDLQNAIDTEISRKAANVPWESEVSAGFYKVQVHGKANTFPLFNSGMMFVRVGLPMPHGVTIGGII